MAIYSAGTSVANAGALVGAGKVDLLYSNSWTSTITGWNIDNVFSAAYRIYKLYLYTATSGAGIHYTVRFRTGGASGTTVTDSNYMQSNYSAWIDRDNAAEGTDNKSQNTNSSGFQMWQKGSKAANHKPHAVEMTIYDPYGATVNNNGRTRIIVNEGYFTDGNEDVVAISDWYYDEDPNATGLNFNPSSQGMQYGQCYLYGIKWT